MKLWLTFRLLFLQMNQIYKEKCVDENCHPFKIVLLPLMQIPPWLVLSISIRKFCAMLPDSKPSKKILLILFSFRTVTYCSTFVLFNLLFSFSLDWGLSTNVFRGIFMDKQSRLGWSIFCLAFFIVCSKSGTYRGKFNLLSKLFTYFFFFFIVLFWVYIFNFSVDPRSFYQYAAKSYA